MQAAIMPITVPYEYHSRKRCYAWGVESEDMSQKEQASNSWLKRKSSFVLWSVKCQLMPQETVSNVAQQVETVPEPQQAAFDYRNSVIACINGETMSGISISVRIFS